MQILELLNTHRDTIRKYLSTSDAQWNSMASKIKQREQWEQPIAAEKIWTFLVACGYAVSGSEGVTRLSKLLTGVDLATTQRIWFEAQSVGPRDPKSEGKTHIDLALGMIRAMGATASGIELATSKPGGICFCEMKWNTDIASGVTYDTTRNQLARDIENAVCFQTGGRFTKKVFFVVVTPRNFETSMPNSLLREKYIAYTSDRAELRKDLDKCKLPRNPQWNWHYPKNLSERLSEEFLTIRWVFFEDLIKNLPTSVLSPELQKTWENETTSDY